MGGDFESESYATEKIFAIPDMRMQKARDVIAIPYLGSLILTHSLSGKVPGLKDFSRDLQPNATILFFTFRFMVGRGVLKTLLGFWSLGCRWRSTLYNNVWLHRAALLMGPAGWIAIICGWMTTEIGLQPFWQAASPPLCQLFLLVGAAALIIMAFSAYLHYVFRGKVGTDAHYH